MSILFRNKLREKLLDLFRRTNQLKVFKQYLSSQYNFSAKQIDIYQEKKCREIFEFHYFNNTSYRKFLNEKGFELREGYSFIDIPFVDKEYFKLHFDTHSIISEAHVSKSSGGSTGVPLSYFLSKESAEGVWPAIWRAFDEYNIAPCDNIAMIAGPSLFNNRSFSRRVYDWINGFYVISAFDLSDDALLNAYHRIIDKKIKAIYGYTSSVLIFLQFLQRKNLKLSLKAIFTTSESFIPSVRRLARQCCDCDVIDTYGANDGGVSSFECRYHTGYHLNFERCFVEIIDGEIILTDLLNTSSPFIRYRVGDCTKDNKIEKGKCKCGRSLYRLANVSGRINQSITDIDGTKIHTEFFSHLFKEDQYILQYQITQTNLRLRINLLHDIDVDHTKYIEHYSLLIGRRFKMPFEIVFNEPIIKLTNQKTPILINNDA